MKTVVTGGTGFIGSNLVKRLVDSGRKVIVTSRLSPDDNDNLAELGVHVERCNVDLRNFRDTLAAIEGADSVFHLAAMVGNFVYLHGNQTAELTSLQTNLMIDANVFRACFVAGVKKIIYASSCAVYPIDKQITTGAIFREDEVQLTSSFTPNIKAGMINPDGGYGWAKLMGEIQLNWTKGTDIGIARIFNIYGENETLREKTHVIGDLIHRSISSQGGDLIVHGDGKQSRDFLHVSDCTEALLKLEEKANNPPLTVNIGSGKAMSISTLAQKIVLISGKKFNVVFDSTKPVGSVSRTADISRAKSLIGWEPEVSLDKGLRHTYAWMQRKLMNNINKQ